jgi:hypothetical protein
MLDLETFRKEIDEIYSERVKNMVGQISQSTVEKHNERMRLEKCPV